MKKYVRKLGLLLAFLFFIVSCDQNPGSKGKQEDPKLILRSLKIHDKEDIDITTSPITCEVGKERIVSTNIVAKFDYGEEKDEAIRVELEGGAFTIDRTQPKAMVMTVPAVEGLYQEWIGTVMVSFELQDIEVAIIFNGQPQPDGTEEELQTEVIEFVLFSTQDIIEKTIINDGKKDYELMLEEQLGGQGKYYINSLRLNLNTDEYTTYNVTVKPKDPTYYRDTVATYRIKGNKVADNNAEFIYISDGVEPSPNVVCDIKWTPGCESPYYEDYGAKSLKMTAYTVNPRASVFVKRVNPLDDSIIQGTTEIELTNDGYGRHIGEITLLDDKPTKLVAYVRAKDGTTDNQKGKWQVEFNAVELFWGYDNSKLSTDALRKGASKSYSEIKIEKSKVINGKIFVAFSIWGENLGFKPGNEIPNMTDYLKLDSFGDKRFPKQAYLFSVNVSDLAQGSEKEIEIPVLRIAEDNASPIEAFKYKFKIKVE